MQYFVTCGFDRTFSGNSNENFIAWRKSLLKYAKFISMPDDKLIEYIACLLHGRALRFYETLPTETTSNLNKLLNALQNRFRQWSTTRFDYTGLLERYQQLDESVEEYSNVVMANLERAEIEDEYMQMYYYMRGLLPQIKYEVQKMNPKSLQECENRARIVEAVTKQNYQLYPGPDTRQSKYQMPPQIFQAHSVHTIPVMSNHAFNSPRIDNFQLHMLYQILLQGYFALQVTLLVYKYLSSEICSMFPALRHYTPYPMF